MKATAMEQSHILEQALSEHLRAYIDPTTHHTAGGRVDLKGERIEHDLGEMIVVAISVNELLEVVKDLKLPQKLSDALVA